MNETGIVETAGEREALKPCPFCGGGEIRHEPLDFQNGSLVMCESCGGSTDAKRSNRAAIEAWNLRAAPPIAPGERGAFELLCKLVIIRRSDRYMSSDPGALAEWNALWKSAGDIAAKAQAPAEPDPKEHACLRAVYEAARLVIQSHCHPVTVAELSKAIEAVKDT